MLISQTTEKKAVKAMIALYCRKNHHTKILCEDCNELLNYCFARIEHCKFKEDKPNCDKCPAHCYNKTMREKIRIVMRYSGPRILYHKPLLAIGHLLRNLKKKKY